MLKKLQDSYIKISAFLNQNRELWEKEVIENPYACPVFDAKFDLKSLNELSYAELYKITLSNNKYPHPTLSELGNFISTIKNEILKKWVVIETNKLSPPGNQNISHKKKHEFSNIIELLTLKELLPSQNTILDYCGGAGYLSRTLAYYYNTATISLDNNLELQNRGKIRHSRYIPKGAKAIDLINKDLNISNPDSELNNLPFIGIHACGHLTDSMLNLSVENNSGWLLAVGCCYHKTENLKYQISEFAKNLDFTFTKESLMLASRGHDTSFENFEFSMKVKHHRYLIHLLLERHYGYTFTPIGKSKPSDYDLTFSEFAQKKLELVLKRPLNKEDLKIIKIFEEDQEINLTLKKLLLCNFLRTFFSELLELLIVIDRAIFLEENNFKSEIYELFKRNVSPRNFAIFGEKENLFSEKI